VPAVAAEEFGIVLCLVLVGLFAVIVLRALLHALRNDTNAGVRLKAMDGLRPFVLESVVRKALAGVLLSDGNPGMRTQAIDLLTQGVGETTDNATANGLDREMIVTLQELMNRENNADVRQRGERVLQFVNASQETY